MDKEKEEQEPIYTVEDILADYHREQEPTHKHNKVIQGHFADGLRKVSPEKTELVVEVVEENAQSPEQSNGELDTPYEKNVIPFAQTKGIKKDVDPLDALFGPMELPEEEILPDNIVKFPDTDEDQGVVTNLIKGLRNRADDYAEHMFEEDERTDPEEVRRIEKLVPGTDEENEQEEYYAPSRRRPKLPPKDIPPAELQDKYSRGLVGMKLRCILLTILTMVGIVPIILSFFSYTLPPQMIVDPRMMIWGYMGLLGLGMLLSIDVLLQGLWRAMHLKFGMDTLVTLSCIATMIDSLFLSVTLDRDGQMPYCAINILALWLLLDGSYKKRCGLRISCRIAATAKNPYRVTLDEKKWSGRDTYCKWSGTTDGFGSQIQMDDGAQRIYKIICPILLLCAIFCAAHIGYKSGDYTDIFWPLSAMLTLSCALGSTIAYGRVSRKLAQRLAKCGATLAGWGGVLQSQRGDRVLLTDTDLFPTGFIQFTEPRIFEGYSAGRIISYCASIYSEDNNSLSSGFYDLLRRRGGFYRSIDEIAYYEGGGVVAKFRNDRVLVGTAAFMNLMEIELPSGLQVNQAVYCAMNGELAAIFPLKYTMQDSVYPSIYALLGERVAPILATRDFNLIPTMLAGRFNLPTAEMDFPPTSRRRELSDPNAPHSEVITAVLCREGLTPFAEAIISARRLRIATRASAIICCCSSALGLFLASYLTQIGAYSSLSPLNLMIFLLTWLLPVWCVSEWGYRF